MIRGARPELPPLRNMSQTHGQVLGSTTYVDWSVREELPG